MSTLFPDIVQCMSIQVLDIKKSQLQSWVVGEADEKWYTCSWSITVVLAQRKLRALSLAS